MPTLDQGIKGGGGERGGFHGEWGNKWGGGGEASKLEDLPSQISPDTNRTPYYVSWLKFYFLHETPPFFFILTKLWSSFYKKNVRKHTKRCKQNSIVRGYQNIVSV
jgi:hypothetical protein